MVGEILHHLHLLRGTTVHIVDDVVHHLVQTGRNRLRKRTDFRESVGYQLKSLDILIHLRDEVIVRIIHLEDFYPSHQAGDRSTQLVSRFLR